MYEDLADFAIKHALKLGATYAESRLEHTSGNGFLLKNGILEESAFAELYGLGIRFVKDKTLGFISVNDFNKDAIRKIVDSGYMIEGNLRATVRMNIKRLIF